MVLTEPDAGSDVGSTRTRAVNQHDGTRHIEGVKRFITSGHSDDLFENIAHPRARTARRRARGHQGA
jgi:alkylation response protein AidB-like acyl-CoA dehydrogenase